MPVKTYRPTTPARRGMTTRDNSAVTAKASTKSLLRAKKGATGRSRGQITVRHRGAGVKRFYRIVDFKGISGAELTVKAVEYDPNRSANVALVADGAGRRSYLLAGAKMKVGTTLKVGDESAIKAGNRLTLSKIPLGSSIYNLELKPGRGGQLVRGAGTSATLAAKDKNYAQVKLPSGEIRLIPLNCYATLGSVGNEAHRHIKWGSAGRRRRLGWRPSVRGKAMNPADHPMGGGEGKSSPGRLPRTPWGKIAIGPKTRSRKKSNNLIVRSRKLGRR